MPLLALLVYYVPSEAMIVLFVCLIHVLVSNYLIICLHVTNVPIRFYVANVSDESMWEMNKLHTKMDLFTFKVFLDSFLSATLY